MLKVENLCKKFKNFYLQNINFSLEKEYCILLGPSGAGKTLLLKCLCGIYKPDRGRIFLKGKDITELPPEGRNIAYVPQNYGLFPNKNVFKNIAYPLELRKIPKGKIEEEIERIARFLKIEHLLRRRISTLSGGERQRVALARALIIKPFLLLLDEPLSSIDQKMRETLIEELRKIRHIPVIHVTHDFVEALNLGKKIGILMGGRLVDFGTKEILKNPKSKKVAEFLGFNFIEENLVVHPQDVEISFNSLEEKAIVKEIFDYGTHKKVYLLWKDKTLKAFLSNSCPDFSELSPNQKVSIKFKKILHIEEE